MRIYTDESRTKADQGPFMLIGGIICDKETSKEIRQDIKLLKTNPNLPAEFEFHFAKIQPRYIEFYKKLVDVFFNFYDPKCQDKRGLEKQKTYRKLCFEALLIPHEKIDHHKFSGGDAELGFFQFYYTLLAHSIKKHHVAGKKFHVTIDAINTRNHQMVPNLHKRLNSCCLPSFTDPVLTVHRQNSKAELLLQMADVILGSVSFTWNKLPTVTNMSNETMKAKREVAQYVETKLGKSLSKKTYHTASFNIWELNL